MGRSDKNVLPKNPSSAQNTKDDSIDWNVPLLVKFNTKGTPRGMYGSQLN